MAYTQRITEVDPIVATTITTNSIGSWYSDAVSLAGDAGRKFRWIVNVPTLAGGATVDFGIQTSATSGGTYAALSGASITQEATGNKLFQIEVATEYILNTVSTAQYMKGYLKVATASATPSVVCYAVDPVHLPTTDSGTGVQAANLNYA